MTKTRVVKVDPQSLEWDAIEEAVTLLEKGGLVAFPTETVYGIAANLLHQEAIARLKKIKDRPEQKQFSIHVANKRDIEKYAVDILPRAYKVIDKLWPGPLTVVLPAPHEKSVGLRMPSNDVALSLLGQADFPVVAPSANLADHAPPRDAEGVLKDLDGLIDLVLDAGRTALGRESTVLDCRRLPFSVLREGALKKEEVLALAGQKTVLFVCTGNSCRSVMAEYLLRKKMADLGRRDVEAASAGTFALFGMGPTRETQKLVQEVGLDASGHKARRLTEDLIRKADLILAMEERHRDEVLRLCEAAKNRVHLLSVFTKIDMEDPDIPDPIGRPEEFYRASFEKIKAAVDKLAALI